MSIETIITDCKIKASVQRLFNLGYQYFKYENDKLIWYNPRLKNTFYVSYNQPYDTYDKYETITFVKKMRRIEK